MKFIKKNKKQKMLEVQKPKTRQELRKIQRKEKKARKNKFFQNKSVKKQQEKQIEVKNLFSNSRKLKKDSFNVKQNKESKSNIINNIINDNVNLLKTKENKLEKEMNLQRIKQLKLANKSEDKLIKKLEKDLKLRKRKSKCVPQSFAADGLDYLLEVCNSEKFKSEHVFDKENLEEESCSEFENDDDDLITRHKKRIKKNENKEGEDQGGEEDEDEEDEVEKMEGGDETIEEDEEEELEEENGDEELEEGILSDEENNSEKEETLDDSPEENKDIKEKEELWEDIYGRTRDAKGNILTGKYMPPQKREIVDNKNENTKRIERQLKGLLNRLSESNLKSIANQIEEIYQSNSRHSINFTLINLLFDSLVAPTFTPERLIMEHCMLIAILHAHIGAEIGAQILQDFVKKFFQEYNQHGKSELEGKELVNLVLVIAYMYNFKIFNSLLIYDILDLLANGFQEKDIELILNILKSVGFSLRKDDPIALKKLVLNLQSKANSIKGDTSRCQFMLDILLAIKNNNMTKIPNYDPTHLEHLKKLIKSLLRKGMYVSELKISLEDLLKAEERGRWWVVGSAWRGQSENETQKTTNQNNHEFSQKLLQLARKQRMNTDARRNIFCILMSAHDYTEAYEKLLHLGLKNQQERDIIYVLVHCCLQEKKFNPYYGYIVQQLCLYERRFQLTVQYTLWDRLKELSNLNKNQISNLASLIKHLILERALPLTALKVVEFTQMNKSLLHFLRELFLGLLMERTEEDCRAIFEKVSLIPKLKQFRDGLRLFLNYFLLKKIDQVGNVNLLKERVDLINKMLEMAEHNKGIF